MINLNDYRKELHKDIMKETAGGEIASRYYKNEVSKDVAQSLNGSKDLSRDIIFKEKNTRRKLVLILIWGYRKDTRNTPTILGQIDKLEKLTEIYRKTKNGEEYLKGLLSLNRLGLSTASKILYFMEAVIDNHPCIIVDARVESALPLVEELNDIKHNDDIAFYEEVIKRIDKLHKEYEIPHANIEYFLYNLGKDWDYYMSLIGEREAKAATKESLERIAKERKEYEKQEPVKTRRESAKKAGKAKKKTGKDNSKVLRVYDKIGTKNYGKTFEINGNKGVGEATSVYVVFEGERYQAGKGTYNSHSNTLGGKSIQNLIEAGKWLPGKEFLYEFEALPDGTHLYKIKSKQGS